MKKQEYKTVILGGGLDLVTPPLSVPPGKLLQVKNFECDLDSGYSLFGGFERFDGLQSPVDSDFYFLELTSEDGAVVGNTATGATSGASGVIIALFGAGETGIYIAAAAGLPFSVGEGFTSGLTGTVVATERRNVVSSVDDFKTVRLTKEIYYRDLIGKAGSSGAEGGPLGTWRHQAIQIVFRNKTGGASAGMYVSSASGFTEVNLGHIVFFNTAANAALAIEGATVSDGASDTATIEAAGYSVVGKNDLGYFVLSGFTAGFAVAANMTIGGSAVGTVTTAGASIVLSPDGRHEFRSNNFLGGTASYNVYGVDGVNPAFEYWPDRNIYVPIYTDLANITLDNPTFVGIYQSRLWVGFERGITRNSNANDVLDWDAAISALEIGVGAPVTGMDETAKSLIVTTQRTTKSITGNGATTPPFQIDDASENTGAIPYTVQHIGTTSMVDDRGFIELSRVQAFGNFENATVSRDIQKKVIELRPLIVASTISLSKNIYRLFASNGEGISMTFEEGRISFSIFNVGRTVTCASNAEDATGVERIFFGSGDGFVYEMDKGRSFDGESRQSWLQFSYHFMDSPTILKKFFRLFISTLIDGGATVKVAAVFSLGSRDRKSTQITSVEISSTANLDAAFDIGLFDVVVFDDVATQGDAYANLKGSGDSIGITISHNSASDDLFTLQDLTYYFKKRRAYRSSR